MTDALVIGIGAPLAAIIGATLTYYATRKRDTSTAGVERGRVELDSAKAALEAWAEYATVVREDVHASRARIADLETTVAATQRALDNCLKGNPLEQ